MKSKRPVAAKGHPGARALLKGRLFTAVSASNLGHGMKGQPASPNGLRGGKIRADEPHELTHTIIASMFEHLPSMVFVKDARDLRFIHFNQAGEKLLGYSRLELVGKNDYDFFPKEEADFFTAKDREVFSRGQLVDIPEEPVETQRGDIRILHTKKIPIFDAEGKPQYLLGISEDITEQKEAEQLLSNINVKLEQRIFERTRELEEANAALQKEMTERQGIMERLHDLSARLIHAQEEERSRIAREVHDDFSQQLAIIGIELERLSRQDPGSIEQHKALCAELWQKVRQLSSDLHSLSHKLHPSKLEHLGLMPAVRSLCVETSQLYNVDIECTGRDVPTSLPQSVALCMYRVAQEALRNMVKHSGARQSKVDISAGPALITMHVSDSGKGFDPDLAAAKNGLGLISIEERVRGVGGQIVIQSAPSQGTSIEIRVPLPG
jgi:PAS domain S-box-containing protein